MSAFGREIYNSRAILRSLSPALIGQQVPTLEELISWMLYDKTIIDFASKMAERMGGIHLLAKNTDEAQANQHAEIESNDLIVIRLLSRAD